MIYEVAVSESLPPLHFPVIRRAVSKLDIVYLLEAAPLFGGVKVVLHQANLLAARGHRVTIVCPSEAPEWYPLRATWRQTTGLEPHEIPKADVVVATFWTTLSRALRADAGQVVHFCQGFEGELEHNVAEHPAILQAYRNPVPAITVSPHLATMIRERFDRPARVIPQPLENWWRPRRRWAPARPARILATGPWEIYLKGVPVAAEAVRRLRQLGHDCTWVRLSQWPLCDEERAALDPDEFHCHLRPDQVPELVRSCDLLLAPSWPVEGFGLPVLEAMASGVPSVASDIPSFRAFADGASILVPREDAGAFARAASSLLSSGRRWRRHRRHGLNVAKAYRESVAVREIEAAFLWAIGGRWQER